MDILHSLYNAEQTAKLILNNPELFYEKLKLFSTYPCSIMLFAFIIESFIPIPAFLRLNYIYSSMCRLGFKVNRKDNSQQQNFLSGLFLCLLAALISILLLEILKFLSCNDIVVVIITLTLLLSLRDYQVLSQRFCRLMSEKALYYKEQGKALIAPHVLRDTTKLSDMGMSKALSESVIINTASRFYAVLFWYAILDLEGALVTYLVTVLCKAFSIKKEENIPFGLSIYRVSQAIFLVPYLTIALLLALRSLRPYKFLKTVFTQCTTYPNFTTGILLSATGLSLDLKLSGPRFYSGDEKVRYEPLGGDHIARADSPLLCMRIIRMCGIIFICFNFIIYIYNMHSIA